MATSGPDFVSMFLSVLFALIVKEFYDMFIQTHIKNWLSRYKLMIVANKERMRNSFDDVRNDRRF